MTSTLSGIDILSHEQVGTNRHVGDECLPPYFPNTGIARADEIDNFHSMSLTLAEFLYHFSLDIPIEESNNIITHLNINVLTFDSNT